MKGKKRNFAHIISVRRLWTKEIDLKQPLPSSACETGFSLVPTPANRFVLYIMSLEYVTSFFLPG